MALKRKIDKATFDALSDVLKAEYKENPSRKGEYILDTDGDEDADAAKRARDHEKKRADELAAKLAEIETAKKTAEEEAARSSGNVAALEASWKEKLATAEKARKDEMARLNAMLRASHIDAVAEGMAAEISEAPKLLAPLIKARLDMDMTGETPLTRVLDATGKPSASSLNELKAEFLANKEYAAIMRATNASGGGAGNPSRLPPLGGGAAQKPDVDLSKLSGKDLAAHMMALREAKNS